MLKKRVIKMMDQWAKSRAEIIFELNSRSDLDYKTIIQKGKQLEDLNQKITVLALVNRP